MSEPEVERFTFGKLRLGSQIRITREFAEQFPGAAANGEIRSFVDIESDNLVFQLRTWLMKTPHPAQERTVRWPATWWDHFKLRWFPAWLKARYPVEYDEETYEYGPIHVCPHIAIKWPENAPLHFDFLKSVKK
jgi:hypothetical protein